MYVSKLCCLITTGATGEKGKRGATGFSGYMNTRANNRTTTTQSPCIGPVGEDACTTSNEKEYVEQLKKVYLTFIFQLLCYSLTTE